MQLLKTISEHPTFIVASGIAFGVVSAFLRNSKPKPPTELYERVAVLEDKLERLNEPQKHDLERTDESAN